MVTKSVWDLPGGPWEKLFAGVWNKFNVAAYQNKDNNLLTTIFPKEGDINWIMIRVDRILIVPRDIEKLVEKIKGKHIHVLKKQIPGRSSAYLILLTPPRTVEFGSKVIGSEVLDRVIKLQEEVADVKTIAEELHVDVIDISDASYTDSAGLMGDPSLLLSILDITPEERQLEQHIMKEIPIGSQDNKIFSVKEDIFNSLIAVRAGTKEERAYATQLLVESAMIDPTPTPLLITAEDYNIKLNQNNPYPYDYSKYDIDAKGTAFDVKTYKVSDPDCELKINLGQLSEHPFWNLLGIGKDESSTMIVQAYNSLGKKSGISIEDLIKKVEKTQAANDKEKFFVARAVRILNLVKKVYGDIFGSQDSKRIVSDWIKSDSLINVDLTGLSDNAKLAHIINILEILESLINEGTLLTAMERRKIQKMLLCIVGSDSLSQDGILQKYIARKIISMNLSSLFVSAEELQMELESRIAYKFYPLGPDKIKMQLHGRTHIFEPRPLITCPP